MHGLKSGSCRIWQRTDLPPGSNMLRRAAQTCSACKLAGVQIIPLPTLANQILARTFFGFRHAFVCVPSRWKVLSGEFRRRPTSLAVKLRKSDRVGRRGLFEPREDFSRLHTYAIPLFDSVVRFRCSIPLLVSVADFGAQNLQLISLPTSQGQQRTHIQAQPASGD
jgi:hypothetical protein